MNKGKWLFALNISFLIILVYYNIFYFSKCNYENTLIITDGNNNIIFNREENEIEKIVNYESISNTKDEIILSTPLPQLMEHQNLQKETNYNEISEKISNIIINNPKTTSDHNNNTQITEKEKKIIIFGAFFAGKKDPIHNNVNNPYNNCFEYIKNWYESIHSLQLNAILFHDGLSKEFISNYTTENFQFQFVNNEKLHPKLYPAEWRFIVYYDYLIESSNDIKSKYDYILFTDVSDVIIQRNPIHFFNHYLDKDFFFSFEEDASKSWVSFYWKQCLCGEGYNISIKIHSAAMWAAKIDHAISHLYLMKEKLISITEEKDSPGVCDMLAHIQLCNEVWLKFNSRTVWDEGQPLYNKIKSKVAESQSDLLRYFIVHKRHDFSCNNN